MFTRGKKKRSLNNTSTKYYCTDIQMFDTKA